MKKHYFDCKCYGDFISIYEWRESCVDMLADQMKQTIATLIAQGEIEFPITLEWKAIELSEEERLIAENRLVTQEENAVSDTNKT